MRCLKVSIILQKENEEVQYDVKFNSDKDLNLTNDLHVADNFSNNILKKKILMLTVIMCP